MSGTTWPWPRKSRWAWNIVPFYNQAVEDGATDTFFSELFSRWFDRFPIRLEEFKSGQLFGQAVEAEKERVKNLIKCYKLFNHEEPTVHWTVLFNVPDHSLSTVLSSVPEHSRTDKSHSPDEDELDSVIPRSPETSTTCSTLVTPTKGLNSDTTCFGDSDLHVAQRKRKREEAESPSSSKEVERAGPTKRTQPLIEETGPIKLARPLTMLAGAKRVRPRLRYRRSSTPLPLLHQSE